MAEVLQGLVDKLTIPGLPGWVALVLLVAIAVSVLAFLAMPFSVFGVKSRLEAVEAELADLRTEIRALIRQPGSALPPRAAVDDDWVAPPPRGGYRAPEVEPRLTPPVPPPAARPARAARSEPRLDWPGTKGG
ncbi:hypothetical protein GXW74_08595 [Roseomonas eburnea]|uniref:Uncharacterized protein n=1 Tax=Neoroseomonas eburnea TaxID=1346889 RepID=A0A9X9XA07_9PROT|nr:hypothetical protein [Neoroseomonas eburnea]MBR0680543.1 hypothetical protein [Neoroseomonas eburnea]